MAQSGLVQAQHVTKSPPLLFTFSVVVASLGGNLLLSLFNESLSLPFFFDSVFTSIAALTVGLVPALVVATGTNALLELVYGMDGQHFPFFICGVATVLILRGFRRAGYFSTVGHALLASLAVALANAVLGSMVATFLYGGVTGVGIDFLVAGLVAGGQSVFSAAFWARVPANLIDKSIAVFAAYFLRRPVSHLAYRFSLGRLPVE